MPSAEMRSLGISLVSMALTTVVLANAYYQKKQFYPAVVYITKSNPSMAVSTSAHANKHLPSGAIAGDIHAGVHRRTALRQADAEGVLRTAAHRRVWGEAAANFGRRRLWKAGLFQHLMERAWYAITETCLAFTVFRDDFNPKFVALFTLLLFLKSFHWLAEDRVDYVSLFIWQQCASLTEIDIMFQHWSLLDTNYLTTIL